MGPTRGKLSAALVALVAAFTLHSASAMATLSVGAAGNLVDPQAGAHSDLNLTLTFGDYAKQVKELRLHLPAGLLGDPSDQPTCSAAAFAVDSQTSGNYTEPCPANTRVGQVTLKASIEFNGSPLDLNGIAGEIYLLDPVAGEPARLGIFVTAPSTVPIRLQAPIVVRTTGDYGLDVTYPDLPTSAVVNGVTRTLWIQQMTIQLWGPTSGGVLGNIPGGTETRALTKPFLINPPTCETQPFKVEASSYAEPNTFLSGSFDLKATGCDQLKFQPGIGTTDPLQADQPNSLAVAVAFPHPTASDLAQIHLKDLVVRLPQGIAISPGMAANGLAGCSDDQFGKGSDTDPSCPSLSEIGDVALVSPLIGLLTGKAYLGDPQPGKQFRVLFYARKGAVRVKLEGLVSPDQTTGRITASFSDLPRQPFDYFVVAFRGGDTGVLTAPQTCGTQEVSADFTPYLGNPVTRTSTITTTGCGAVDFAPTFFGGPSPLTAGADSHLSVTFNRPDGQARLSKIGFTMPPGQMANLFNFPACPLTQARAGQCNETSRVGTVTVSAGTGGRPLALQGSIYLVEPYDGGVGGLAVVVPVKVGPLDLGTIINITKLHTREGDLAIQGESDPLPTMLDGIPIAIRTLKLDIDRDGFLLNGTNCGQQPFRASFTSVDGRTAISDALVGILGCSKLPFAPTLTGSLTGDPRYPTLKVNVHSSRGQANLWVVTLALPGALGVNLPTVQGGCRAADFAANRCPASSIVGRAKASSPLLKDPLTGPVRMVEDKGKVLPKLYIDLNGLVHVGLWSSNQLIDGHIVARVEPIPDVPITDFELELNNGKKGLLAAGGRTALCAHPPNVVATLVSQTGAVATSATTPAVDCGLVIRPPVGNLQGFGKGHTPSLSLKIIGSSLRRMAVTLPKSLSVRKHRFTRGARALVSGRAARAVRRTSARTVTVTAWKAGKSLQLVLNKHVLQRRRGLKIGHAVTLRVQLWDAKNRHKTVKVRLIPRR